MDRINFSVIVIIFSDIFVGLVGIFCYCYFGEKTSESFQLMSECLYECNWPDLPIKLKKHIVIMMLRGQKPIYYHGFKMVTLNLETFKKVRRTDWPWHFWFNEILTHLFFRF